MSGIRVYEAARKLDMDTSRLMKLLSQKGIKIKSPISFVTQAELDNALSIPKPVRSLKPAPKKRRKKRVAKKKRKLSLVTTNQPKKVDKSDGEVIPIERAKKEEVAKVKQAIKPDDASEAKADKGEHKPDDAKKDEPAEIPHKPAAKEKTGSGALAYVTLALATAAMIAVLLLNSRVTNDAAIIDKAVNTASAVGGRVAILDDSVRLNKDMILKNQSSIKDISGNVGAMKLAEARLGVMNRSAALKELSSSLPGDMALRVKTLSESLRALGGTL